ncbi:MAG: hypothetical protein IPN69_08655 [Acidobacteria bacterium]|nr:hypothetical protein [Acidobacteriota bacterium]
MKTDERIILPDDPEAVTAVTVHGWKTIDGFIYLDERAARYASSTHCLCKTCGKPARKPYTKCDGCRELADIAKYDAMPREEWDGKAVLYSDALSEYYSSLDDAEDQLPDDMTLEGMRLIICRPVTVRPLDGSEWGDDIPEGEEDLPPPIEAAINQFNEATRGIVLSWRPGKTALKLDAVQQDGEPK